MILFVETDDDPASVDAIRSALRADFPVTHQPDHLVHLEKLPRNSRGKIDYTRLRSIATAPRQ
jgi:acyl-coenzyme A synthetase/AMP-(fatty) acid ligase